MPGSANRSVAEYLNSQPKPRQAALSRLRASLKKALPDADEVISYSMPAFRQEGIVVWYAAASKHYAIYVYPRVKELFKEDLTAYKGTKSSIHFEYDKSVPVRLITRIAKESLKQNLAKKRAVRKLVAKMR